MFRKANMHKLEKAQKRATRELKIVPNKDEIDSYLFSLIHPKEMPVRSISNSPLPSDYDSNTYMARSLQQKREN